MSENPLTSVCLGLAKIIKDDNYKSVFLHQSGGNLSLHRQPCDDIPAVDDGSSLLLLKFSGRSAELVQIRTLLDENARLKEEIAAGHIDPKPRAGGKALRQVADLGRSSRQINAV